jgi:hypothetical protein
MARTFSDTTSNSRELFRRAQRLAKENNVSLEGDESAGRFEGGGFLGTWRTVGNTVTVTYVEKPLIVPWAVVQSRTVKFIR